MKPALEEAPKGPGKAQIPSLEVRRERRRRREMLQRTGETGWLPHGRRAPTRRHRKRRVSASQEVPAKQVLPVSRGLSDGVCRSAGSRLGDARGALTLLRRCGPLAQGWGFHKDLGGTARGAGCSAPRTAVVAVPPRLC